MTEQTIEEEMEYFNKRKKEALASHQEYCPLCDVIHSPKESCSCPVFSYEW